MLAAAASLLEAIDSPRRRPFIRVQVDWNRDGAYSHPCSDVTAWVADLDVDRALTGDLPAAATLVEGTSAATVTATLEGRRPGDTADAVDVFAFYRADSPLYQRPVIGAPARVTVGFQTAGQVRVFTGRVRGIAPVSGTRRVALDLVDDWDRLRAPVTLPAHGVMLSDALKSGHRWRINSQALIDHALRSCGIYASPPPHPRALVSCTGHGWYAAERGISLIPRGIALPYPTDESWWFAGPFGGMLANRSQWSGGGLYQQFLSRGGGDYDYRPAAGYGIGMSAWVYTGPNYYPSGSLVNFLVRPLVDDNWYFRLAFDSAGSVGGGINAPVGNVPTVYKTTTLSARWKYVGVHYQHNSGGKTVIRIRVDGTTLTQEVDTPPLSAGLFGGIKVNAYTAVPWTNFQVWDGPPPADGQPWHGETHTSQASLTPGLNSLEHLPDVVEQEAATFIRDVVGAEHGLFGFTETGRPFFRSRAVSSDPGTVDKTVTAARSIIDLGSELTVDTVRNVVSTETRAGMFVQTGGIFDSPDEAAFDSPVGFSSYRVDLPHDVMPFQDATLPKVAAAAWNDATSWGFVAVRAAEPDVEIPDSVDVRFRLVAPRQAVIMVRNRSQWPVRFATPNGGRPALRAYGYRLQDAQPVIAQYRAEGSVDFYGERVHKLDPSPYRQRAEVFAPIAGGLLTNLNNPFPLLQTVTIVGDPLLQAGDCVAFRDERGQGAFRALVRKVRHSWRGGRFVTQLDVQPINPPGLGLVGDPELGVADSTLVLAP